MTLRCLDSERTVRLRFAHPPATPADATLFRSGDTIHLFHGAVHHRFHVLDPYLPRDEAADRHGGLIAPMPGRIIAVPVKPGDAVSRGQPLVVMEAMKMEHTVTAPADGAVDRILCAVGEQVREGVELLVLRAAE